MTDTVVGPAGAGAAFGVEAIVGVGLGSGSAAVLDDEDELGVVVD